MAKKIERIPNAVRLGMSEETLSATAMRIFKGGKVEGDWREVTINGRTEQVPNGQPDVAVSIIEKFLRRSAPHASLVILPTLVA